MSEINAGIAWGGPCDGKPMEAECKIINVPQGNPDFQPLVNGVLLDADGFPRPQDGKGNWMFLFVKYVWRNGRWEYAP